jgi:uncharacterized coiled-coil DUF342 family protein
VYENKEELEKDLRKVENNAFKKESEVNRIMGLIDEKRKRIDELYEEKKEILNNIRKLIGEGKDHREKRDELHTKAPPRRKYVKNLKKEIDVLSVKVSQLKAKRDGYNHKARGKVDYFKKQITGQFNTLLTMEISLKEEILLFNMIQDLQRRIEAGMKADAFHKEMVANYKLLKTKQEEQWNTYQEINLEKQLAQEEHFASLGKFKEKGRLSRDMDVRSKEISQLKQEINDLYLTIEAVRIAKTRVQAEARYLKRKKESARGNKLRLSNREKLTLAKDKLQKEQKMGLEDLKLLLTSGTLGGKKKDGRKGRRR